MLPPSRYTPFLPFPVILPETTLTVDAPVALMPRPLLPEISPPASVTEPPATLTPLPALPRTAAPSASVRLPPAATDTIVLTDVSASP